MTISIVYGKTENVLNNLSGMDIRLNQEEMENYNRFRFPNDQREIT